MGVAKHSRCGYKMATSKSKPCGVCGLVFSHSSSLSRHVKKNILERKVVPLDVRSVIAGKFIFMP